MKHGYNCLGNRHAKRGKVLSDHFRSLAFFLCCSLAIPSLAGMVFAAGGDELSRYIHAAGGRQKALAAAFGADGSLVLVGYTQPTLADTEDYYVVKIAPDPQSQDLVQAWAAPLTFDLAGGADQAVAVAVDSQGNAVVTGTAFKGGSNGYDIHTVKYNGQTGAVLWKNTWNGPYSGDDGAAALALDDFNNIYVGGYTAGANGAEDFLVLKYNSTGPIGGKPTWKATYNGAYDSIDKVNAIGVSPGVNPYLAVTGISRNTTTSPANFDILTVKYDSAGTRIWARGKDSGTGNDSGLRVRLDAEGSVVMAGYVNNPGLHSDIYLVRYTGNAAAPIVDWEVVHDGGNGDEPRDLALDEAGDVYVTGFSFSMTGFENYFTAKYHGTGAGKGTLAWPAVRTYNSGGDNADIGLGLAVSDDAVYVAGTVHQSASGHNDIVTIKYTRTVGNQLWTSTFTGSPGLDDDPVGIGLTGEGRVLVAGWSAVDAFDYDFAGFLLDPGALGTPTELTATLMSSSLVSLDWTLNSTTENRVEIFRRTAATDYPDLEHPTYTLTGTGISSYDDIDLVPDTRYYYKIRVADASNDYSLFSNEISVVTSVYDYVSPSWTFKYAGAAGADDIARAVAVGPDQNPVFSGTSYSTAGTFDFHTVKLNYSLTPPVEIWSARYDDEYLKEDEAHGVAIDSNNDVIVTGFAFLNNSENGQPLDLYTIKYYADSGLFLGLNPIWARQEDGPDSGNDWGTAVLSARDTSNAIVVVGYGRNTLDNDDIFVVKYLADGTRAWPALKVYDRGSIDHPTAVALAGNGDIIVAGRSHNGSDFDMLTWKLSGVDGATAWTAIKDGGHGDDEASAVAVGSDNNIYSTGYLTAASLKKDAYTVKYLADGQEQWARYIYGALHGNDWAVGIAVDANGDNDAIVVAGSTEASANNHDYFAIRYSAAGTVAWTRVLDRPANNDLAVAMTMDVTGNVSIAGNTDSGNGDILAAKYGYDGELLATTLYNGSNSGVDAALAMAAGRLGHAYVAGSTTNAAGNLDFLAFRCEGSVLQAPAPLQHTAYYLHVDFTWINNSPEADGFRMRRRAGGCEATNTAPWVWLSPEGSHFPATQTSFSDSGLSKGSIYCYQIQAFNASVDSRWLEKTVITIDPPAPADFQATASGTTTVKLTWTDNLNGEDAFEIKRCAGSGPDCDEEVEFTTSVASLGPGVVTYNDATVCSNTTYTYQIQAVKTAAWDSHLAHATVTTQAKVTPTVISAAVQSEGRIDLRWTDTNTDITGFKIYRCEGNDCTPTELIDTVTARGLFFKMDENSWTDAAGEVRDSSGVGNHATAQNGVSTSAAGHAGRAGSFDGLDDYLSWTYGNGPAANNFTVAAWVKTGTAHESTLGFAGRNYLFYPTSVLSGAGAGAGVSVGTNGISVYSHGQVLPTDGLIVALNMDESAWTGAFGEAVDRSGQGNHATSVGGATTVTGGHQGSRAASFDGVNDYLSLAYNGGVPTNNFTLAAWVKTTAIHEIDVQSNVGRGGSSGQKFLFYPYINTWPGTGAGVSVGTNGISVYEAGWDYMPPVAVYNGNLGTGWNHVVVTYTSRQPRIYLNGVLVSTGYISAQSPVYAPVSVAGKNNTGHGFFAGQVDDVMVYNRALTEQEVQNAFAAPLAVYSGALGTGWNHVAVSFIDRQPRIYLNGELKIIGSAALDPTVYAPTRLAGDVGGFGFFNGMTDEVAVYNRVLTSQEIQAYYQGVIPDLYSDTTVNAKLVKPNTTYRYLVSAYKDADCPWETEAAASGVITAITGDVTGPDFAPELLTVTKDAIDVTGRINLTWQDKTGTEENFLVERCAGPACDFSTGVITVTLAANTTSYSDTAVCHDSTYRYRVRSERTSAPAWQSTSNILPASTDPIVGPSALIRDSANSNEQTIKLDWTAGTTDESGFEIWRCTGSGTDCDEDVEFSLGATVGRGVTTYTDTRVMPQTNYAYKVRAVKTSGCPWQTGFAGPLAVDTNVAGSFNLTATALNTTQINLNWNDITTNESAYMLERCAGVCDGAGDFANKYGLGLNSVSYSDLTNVCQSQTYSYRVKAIDQEFTYGNGGCWTRRVPFTISGFQSDSLVEITVNYANGMQTDFDDLRFYQFTDGNQIDGQVMAFWINKKNDGASAVIWLKTGTNADNIYMYYGNSSATKVPVDSGVFEFYDNFTGTVVDSSKWESYGAYDNLYQNNGLRLVYTNTNWRAFTSKSKFSRNNTWTMYYRAVGGGSDLYIGFSRDMIDTNDTFAHGVFYNANKVSSIYENYWVPVFPDLSVNSSYSYEIRVVAYQTGGARYYIRGGQYGEYGYYGTWRLMADTTAVTPLTMFSPLRLKVRQLNGTMVIDTMAVIKNDLTPGTLNIGAVETNVCFAMPREWATAYSNIVPVAALTATPPTGLTGSTLSESEISLSWTATTADQSGVKVERCTGDSTACAAGPFAEVATIATPVVRFDMEEAAWAGAANEIQGAGGFNPATAYNGVTTVAGGHSGRAGSFDGSNDYIRWSYSSGIPTNNFTMAAWVKATTTHEIDGEATGTTTGTAGQRYLFAPDLRSDGSGAGISVGTNGISVYEHSGGYMPPLAVYSGSLGTGWNHIVVTYSDKQPRIYLNGVLVRSGLTSPRAIVYAPTMAGGHNPYGYFPGSIDEVTIYDQALSATEVQNLFSRGTAFVDTALKANAWYTYRLAAFKTPPAGGCPWDQNDIGYSASLTLKTNSPPVPTGVAVTVLDSTDIQITWTDNNSSNTVYEVERSTWDGTAWLNFVVIGTTAGSSQSFIDRTACKGGRYKYRLRAVNEFYETSVIDPVHQVFLAGGGGSNWARSRRLSVANWQADFQVKMVIPHDPDMRADFADLRFWDNTGKVELPYWIEAKTDGVSATIWFKTGANDNIYLVYGNFNAVSQSSGAATFILFDDFNDNQLDTGKWTISVDAGGLPTAETGGVLRFGTGEATQSNKWSVFRSVTSYSRNFVEEFKLKIATFGGSTPKLEDMNAYFVLQADGTGWKWNYWNPGATWRGLAYSPNIGVNKGFVNVKMVRDDTSTSIYENEQYVTKNPNAMSAAAQVGIKLYLYNKLVPIVVEVDDYRLRKYAAVEPGVSFADVETNSDTTLEWRTDPSPESEPISTPHLTARIYSELVNGVAWSKRKPVSIPANFQPNFQTRIVIPYDSDMQPDFDDLRFFDATAGVLLPYWIEAKTDGVSATVWVKTGAFNNIHLYYGHPDAASMSNGVATFEFFDDFNDNSLDTGKWWAGCNLEGCLPYAETDGVFRFGTGPATASPRFTYMITSPSTYSRPLVEEYKMKVVTDPGAYYGSMSGTGGTVAGGASISYTMLLRNATGWYWNYWLSSTGNTSLGYSPNIALNNTVRVKKVWDDTSVKIYENDAYFAQDPNPLTSGVSYWMGFSFKITDITKSVTIDVDDYRIRKHAAVEPVASLSSEESGPFTVFEAPVLSSVVRYSEAQIDLSWSWNRLVDDESGYRIERCEGAATNCTTLTVGANLASYSDKGLLNSTEYCYRISGYRTAVGSCGDGWDTGYGNQLCATTTLPASGPIVPTAADTTKIDLSWTDNTDSEQGFRIWRCTASGTPDFCADDNNYLDRNGLHLPIYQVGANRTNKADPNLCYNTTYYYKIQAKSEDGALALSNSGGGTWNRRARLSFTNFQAEYQTRVVIPWDSDMQSDFDDLRFFDEAWVMEVPYWIESKIDGVSATVWFRTLYIPDSVSLYYGNPNATSSSSPTNAINGISLFGGDFIARSTGGTMPTATFQNSAGYTIEAGVTFWGDNDSTRINFDVSGGNFTQIVYYGDYSQRFVRKTNGSDTGAGYSGPLGIYPKAVMNRWAIKVKDSTYTLFFNGNSIMSESNLPYNSGGINFSRASYYEQSFFDFILVRKYAATEPTVTVLAEEVPPSLALKWGATGNAPLSPAASATTRDVATPAIDPDNTQQLNDTQIQVAWTDGNIDETGFVVERGNAACTNFVALPTVAANVFTTTDSGLTTGQTYCYRVKPYKTLTNPLCAWPDRYSDTQTVTIVPPAPVKLTAVNTETTVIHLEWDDTTTSETGFEVFRCEGAGVACDEDQEFAQVGSRGPQPTIGAKATYDDAAICPAHTYTYQVRTVQNPNWTSPFSNRATAATLATLAPTSLSQSEIASTSADQRQINLSWTDGNADETGFVIERCKVTDQIDCIDNGTYENVGTHYSNLNETFDTQIDPLVWQQTAGLQSVSKITGPPIDIANTSGSARISWRQGNGKAVMHLTSENKNMANSFNLNQMYTQNISWLGTANFEVSLDFKLPNGLPAYTRYHVYARLQIDYANGDYAAIERYQGGYQFFYKRGAYTNSITAAASDTSGRLKIIKAGTYWMAYFWQNNGWTQLQYVNTAFSGAEPAATYVTISQYLQRNEAADVTVEIDNISLLTSPAIGTIEDTFDARIDPAIWGSWSSLNGGSAQVFWNNGNVTDGKAVLKTTSKNLNEAKFNYTNLVASDPQLLGNTDFDITFNYNLPNGAGTYAQHSIPVQFGIGFPKREGLVNRDAVYIERSSNPDGRYFASGTIADVTEYNSLATSETSGKMRVKRTADRIKMYIWQNDAWTLLLEHTRSLVADTMPVWFYFGQYAKRNEDQVLEAEIDNVRIDAARLRYYDQNGAHLLDSSSTYVYRVRAFKTHEGTCSEWQDLYSNTVTEPLTNPAAPTNLVARAAGSKKMELVWTDNATDESEYRIERKLANGTFIEIAVLAADETAYVDTLTLDPDTQYAYRVRAYRGGDSSYSPYSNEATGKTYVWGKLNSDDTTCLPED